MRKAVVVLVVLLLAFSSILLLGCGGKEAAEVGTAEKEEGTVEETPAGEAGEAEQAAPGGGESAQAELPSGYLYGGQVIGSKTPFEYLKLVDVRWSTHEDYFRVVAELKRLDGSDVTNVPWCFADYSDDPTIEYGTEIRLYIRGIKPEDVQITSLKAGHGQLTGDSVCYQILMSTFGSLDGVDPVNLFVSTKTKRPFRLTYATAPLRIILDIWK